MSRVPCADCGQERRLAGRGLCPACYTRMRRRDPAIAEQSRQTSLAWKQRHRDATRAYDAEYNRTHRGTCEGCGSPMGVGRHGDGLCRICRRNGRDQRRELIHKMWHGGAPLVEIAGALDTTVNVLGTEMFRMRSDGWDLPYRYHMKNSQRVAA